MMSQAEPVRTHPRECDKAGIMVNTGEIPGGCIVYKNNNFG